MFVPPIRSWRPLGEESITTRTDHHLGYARTELRSAVADSHHGHRHSHGPAPTDERHCLKSAALRSIPKEDLESEGDGEDLGLFEGHAPAR